MADEGCHLGWELSGYDTKGLSVDHIVVNVSEEYHATCALKNSFVEFEQIKGQWLLHSSLISVWFFRYCLNCSRHEYA